MKKIILNTPEELAAFEQQLQIKSSKRIWHETWKIPAREHDECILLANGGSVAAIQKEIIRYRSKADVYTVNYSLKTEFIRKLQPRVHILADPAYFIDESQLTAKQIQNRIMFSECLQQVDWPMQLAVPYMYCLPFRAKVPGPFIHVSGYPIEGPDPRLPLAVQYKLIEHGLAGFGAQNVMVPVLYLAIVAGYSTIWMAGVDANWCLGLKVDEHCRMNLSFDHFYQKNKDVFFKTRVQDEFKSQYIFHVQMDALRQFAEFMSSRVINLSLPSFLDMFPKGYLGEEPFEQL